MIRQHDTDLNAVFRDTSGHRFSVMLQLMLAVITFLALTLFHLMTDFNWLAWGVIFYVVPLQLILSALRELFGLRKAQAHMHDGHTNLPPIKSTRKTTFFVYGGAMLFVFLLTKIMGDPVVNINSLGDYQPNYGMLSGFAIFAGLSAYNIYIAVWRPQTQPNLAPTRQDALGNSRRVMGHSLRGAIQHLIITALIMGGFLFYFVYWAEFGAPQPLSLL